MAKLGIFEAEDAEVKFTGPVNPRAWGPDDVVLPPEEEEPPTPDPDGKVTINLNLAKWTSRGQPYDGVDTPPPIQQPTLSSGTVRTRIYGNSPHNSRRGGLFYYDEEDTPGIIGGEWDEVFVAWDHKYESGWKMSDATSKQGGGKMGVFVHIGGSGNDAGGGDYEYGSANFRLLGVRKGTSTSQVEYKAYVYTFRNGGQYMTWEDAREYGGISSPQFNVHHRWNHWQCGGNRSATGANEDPYNRLNGNPVYPGPPNGSAPALRSPWQQIGNSRYTGRATTLNNSTSTIGTTDRIEMQISPNSFTGTQTTKHLGSRPKPNADGIFRVWINGVLGMDRTDVIWKDPTAPNVKITRLVLGAFAGGVYEGLDGTLVISNVVLSPTRIDP